MEETKQVEDGQQRQAPPVQVTLGERGLAPRDLNELWKFASMIASSDLAPKQYIGKPGNCAVAIEMGLELGLRPMQALQNIATVNGRPSIYGDAALALVKTSGLCAAHSEHFVGNPYDDDFRAVITTQRRGEKPYVEEFSVGDAKRADLWGKAGPWKQYPRRMLQMRARGFCLRNIYPDVLMGMMTTEEAGDFIETTATVVAPGSDPEPSNSGAPETKKPASKSAALSERIASKTAATKEPAATMPDGGPMPGEAPKAAAKQAPKAAVDLPTAIERANRAYVDAMDAGVDARAVLMSVAGQPNLDGLDAAQVERVRAALAQAVAGIVPPDDGIRVEASGEQQGMGWD